MLLKKSLPTFFSLSLLTISHISFAENVSWHDFNQGMESVRSTAFAFDSHPNEVFAATQYNGLYQSSDNGKSWHEIGAPSFVGKNIKSFAINPKNANEMYVGTSLDGIYKSTDHGQTWQLINNGTKIYEVSAIAFNPQNPNQVFVGMAMIGKLFKSDDGGEHWQELKTGLDNGYGYEIDSIAINPLNPKRISLGLSNTAWRDGNFLQSTDGGLTWKTLYSECDRNYFNQVQYTADAKMLYAATSGGFYRSMNNGLSWYLLMPALVERKVAVQSFVINPDNSQDITISVEKYGIFKSNDGGKTWSSLNTIVKNDAHHLNFNKLAINPSNPDELYLTKFSTSHYHPENIYTSQDAGAHWQEIKTGITNLNFKHVVADPLHAKIFYALGETGLWKMQDQKSWISDPFFANDTINTIAIDPQRAGTMIVSLDLFYSDHDHPLYRTTDNGQSWQGINLPDKAPDITFVAINPANTKQIFVGDNIFTYRSDDDGMTWVKLNDNKFFSPDMFHFNPQNGNEIFIVHDQLLKKSNDDGKTWQTLLTPFNAGVITAFTIDPITPNKIYVGLYVFWHDSHANFYQSNDGGMTWQTLGEGLPQDQTISDIVIDSKNPQVMYASVMQSDSNWAWYKGKGVFISHDSGQTWSPMNTGLNNPIVRELVLNQDQLVANTLGSGLFIADVSTARK